MFFTSFCANVGKNNVAFHFFSEKYQGAKGKCKEIQGTEGRKQRTMQGKHDSKGK